MPRRNKKNHRRKTALRYLQKQLKLGVKDVGLGKVLPLTHNDVKRIKANIDTLKRKVS